MNRFFCKTLKVTNELIPVIQSDSTLSILQLKATSKQAEMLDSENQFNVGDEIDFSVDIDSHVEDKYK